MALSRLGEGGAPGLAAAANNGRVDQDGDGLSDLQELQLGTLPIRADSDRDGFSDLEELARGSEAMSAASQPEAMPYSLGSVVSQEDGYVRVLTTVFTESDHALNLRLAMGVIHQGRTLRLETQDFDYSNRFVRSTSDRTQRLVVIEVGIPARMVRRMGRLDFFAVLGSTEPGAERLVTTQSLANVGGFVARIERLNPQLSASGGSTPQGVVYRPLAGNDELTAAGWESGKVCFQRTAAVGSSGSSIVYEVDAADCIPMDTQCSPGDCSSGVGTSLSLPDPGALIGG